MRALTLALLLLAACDNKDEPKETGQPPGDDTEAPVDGDGDGIPADEDCDDDNPAVFPGADEACNGLDDNCDGATDEGVTSSFYTDADADGYGAGEPIAACAAEEGQSAQDGDCDDDNPAYNPGANETDCADPNDYNCDGSVGYEDADRDGYPACEECDDGNDDVNPGSAEVCDGVDQNCDGTADEGVTRTFYQDLDADAWGDADFTTQACEQPEGYVGDAGDCDDSDPAINPIATEVCDALDNDCDSLIDDDDSSLDLSTASTWYTDSDNDGYGDTNASVLTCEQPSGTVTDNTDCDDLSGATNPAATEICDSIDNNCDNTVDEDTAADASTFYLDSDNDGYGDAAFSQNACARPTGYRGNDNDCDDADAAINPAATEVCDGIDNECDTLIDDADPSLELSSATTSYADQDQDGYGDPNVATTTCIAPSGSVTDDTDCDDTDASVNPLATETCDGVDQDCDGSILRLEEDPDGDGYLACEESLWLSTDSSNNNSPLTGSSTAAGYLSARGIVISTAAHNTTALSDAVLDDYGVLVVHGTGSYGAFTAAEAAAMEDWVNDGGGLLIIAYHPQASGCTQTNSYPSAFGLSCPGYSSGWSGDTSTFVAHDITAGLSSIAGLGGEQWTVASPLTTLASVSGTPVLVAGELGDGKIVGVADEWPYYNAGSGSADISYGSNALMVDNIWAWLLQ